MTTQSVRRAETRTRLLEAAAHLFATRGIDGSSIDAIADLADRTSGAVYDHFGGKEGLLYAMLEGWVDDVAVVINAELAAATTLDERLAT
ncbi:MAG TPA: helix-turn-helix domain-containing protein, partial [Acidimicrobiia bacterium]|nr:helix-turn-helix domain-containing protein [Acidimicrobiia bacterium]